MFRFRLRNKASSAPALSAAEWRARGNEALGRDALDEAASSYRQAIEGDAADPLARVSLGYVLLEQGHGEEATECLTHAIARAASRPDTLADAQFLQAQAQRLLGKVDAAAASLQAALVARPGFAEAAQALVPLLLEADRAGQAVTVARSAAAANPSPLMSMLLGQALDAAGETSEAVAVLDALLVGAPADVGALACRGALLLKLKRADEALSDFDQVLAVQGPSADALCNRAAALLRLGRAQEALGVLDTALALAPEHKEALHSRGQALLALLRVSEARDISLHALRIHPGDPDIEWNCAVTHLLLGEFEPGWRAHESRWRAAGFMRMPATAQLAPRWTGCERLQGATLLLFAEQGMGDTLQFLRYVPHVAAQAKEVLLQVPAAVAPLAGSLAPNCRVAMPGASVRRPDFQCPLLSLPHAFNTTLDNVPARVPYLHAEPARVQMWRDRLGAGGPRKIGIVWSGNPLHTNDHNRSIPLCEFSILADVPARFVSLQPQVREADRAALAEWPGLLDAGPGLVDFAETAAALMALDLIVTVDTSVAHLAGALGRPVWILLPHVPDWRWMLGRTDTPWYPTARLYRQATPGAWEPVLQAVRADLGALA